MQPALPLVCDVNEVWWLEIYMPVFNVCAALFYQIRKHQMQNKTTNKLEMCVTTTFPYTNLTLNKIELFCALESCTR